MKVRYLFAMAAMAICSLADLTSGNPNLRGKIVDASGNPITNTTVFIYSAGPRVGRSSFCPTCYPDCRKRATTDAKGEFEIGALDPMLLFRLLVVNKDYKPQFVPRTDPSRGAVEVKMETRRADFPDHQALRGRVITPEGKPIPRAIVNFDSFIGRDANCGGGCEGVDMVAVADEEGRFTISAEKKFDWMTVTVEAPGFARRKFFELSSEKTHDLKMTEGATMSGRIVKNGKPMAGIGVGFVSVDRSDNFTGNYDTTADVDGMFHFFNVPPYHMYYVYSLMERSDGEFVAPAMKVRVTGDGTHKELGDMELVKGYRVEGRIELSDGKPLPAGVEVSLDRHGAWDWKRALVGADGSFTISGAPAESYSLSVTVPGYTLSAKNKSLDRLNRFSLVGRVDDNMFLRVLMLPGNPAGPEFGVGADAQPYDLPLRGIVEETF